KRPHPTGSTWHRHLNSRRCSVEIATRQRGWYAPASIRGCLLPLFRSSRLEQLPATRIDTHDWLKTWKSTRPPYVRSTDRWIDDRHRPVRLKDSPTACTRFLTHRDKSAGGDATASGSLYAQRPCGRLDAHIPGQASLSGQPTRFEPCAGASPRDGGRKQ